ncbi:MAG: NfeD family protein [Endozoicomonadaceae bacterium]|nr:NfeD family protein [Endozoicomonadaceae bacterium]
MLLWESLHPWHWLILSLILFVLEAFGAAGFLLGAGVASALMSVLLWFMPSLKWWVQLILFGMGTLIMTAAWWKIFQRYNEQTDHPELNNRAIQMVGRVIVLEQPILNGQGKIQIGDTLWQVRSDVELDAGTTVVINGCEGIVLLLAPK